MLYSNKKNRFKILLFVPSGLRPVFVLIPFIFAYIGLIGLKMCICNEHKRNERKTNKNSIMKDNKILIHLALNRGSLRNEKRILFKKYLPHASRAFLNLTSLHFHILLLCYINPDSSLIRIYEHAKIKSSIVLRILVKFKLLDLSIKDGKHLYNVTPLTRCIINDLIQAYKLNLINFETLNKIDKKANYSQIKAKIKTLKQK